MNEVFLDTVGLLAVWDTSDQWHQGAAAAYRILLTKGRRLVSTDSVLLECGNAAARRPFSTRVNVLRQVLMQEKLLVEPTNNYMEPLVRLAVLWRRRSFGCNSETGCRFVERILTVD